MNKGARILVAEDEARISKLVCENLEAEGYLVAAVGDGTAALRAARDSEWDLILLDIMMPGPDGLEVCRTLRKEGLHTPVLFLTARDLTPDRVAGLMAGADDYLVKPFHLDELLSRVHAILRRTLWNETPTRHQFPLGNGWVCLATQEALGADGKECALGNKECGILRLLIEAEGAIVNREKILALVWENGERTTTRTVDNYIVRLRKIFEPEPDTPQHFLTVRGVGYRLRS